MGNLGLGYEVLREVNPSLVILRMPSYGCFGPYAANPGNGGSTEPMTRISYLLGYDDSSPMNSGVMYPDPMAGVMEYAAILIALHHRQVTGRGQLIDISQQETSTAFIGDKILEYTLGGQVPQRKANRDPWMAPMATTDAVGSTRGLPSPFGPTRSGRPFAVSQVAPSGLRTPGFRTLPCGRGTRMSSIAWSRNGPGSSTETG